METGTARSDEFDAKSEMIDFKTQGQLDIATADSASQESKGNDLVFEESNQGPTLEAVPRIEVPTTETETEFETESDLEAWTVDSGSAEFERRDLSSEPSSEIASPDGAIARGSGERRDRARLRERNDGESKASIEEEGREEGLGKATSEERTRTGAGAAKPQPETSFAELSEAAQAFVNMTFVLGAAEVRPRESIAEVASKEVFPKDKTVYSVQVGAFRNRPEAQYFGAFSPVIAIPLPSGVARYLTGIFPDYESAAAARDAIRALGGFEDAFVVVYEDGERAPLGAQGGVLAAEVGVGGQIWSDIQGIRFTIQIGAFEGFPTAELTEKYCPCNRELLDGRLTRWTSGEFEDFEEARARQEVVRTSGVPDAFIVAFRDGQRIPIAEALAARSEVKREEATVEGGKAWRIRVARIENQVSASEAAALLRLSQSVPMRAVTSGGMVTYYSMSYWEKAVADLALKRCKQAGFNAILEEIQTK
jgi:hypothetical protein